MNDRWKDMHTGTLPKHDVMGPITRALEGASLAVAAALVLVNLARLAGEPRLLAWWLPLVLAAGALAADFVSGLVHWTADTWGRESLPFFGARFLKPFRIHHVNPEDILERDFIDCNGDVALLTAPVLLGAALTPLSDELGCMTSLFLAAFGTISLPTNKVHQWAHHPEPPRFVAWLQSAGLILSRQVHAGHHVAPYTTRYCIATGWCNPALEALGLFPALERAISALTGLQPRADERRA